MQKNHGEKMRINITAKQIAFTAIFAAVYAVFRMIPTVPMIGVPGVTFSLSDILVPLFGIILGPYVGGFSVLIGTFVAMPVKPPIFLGLDFLPAFINAVALGFLVRRKWISIITLNVILLFAFALNPLTLLIVNVPFGSTNIAFPFIWVHVIALIVLISPLSLKATKWVEQSKATLAIAGFTVLAFIGTMMQHLMGNILYENIFVYVTNFMTPESLALRWQAVFFLYPIERLILVILAVLVGLPLIRALRKTSLIPNRTPITIRKSTEDAKIA